MSNLYQGRIDKLLSRTDADVVALVPGPNMIYFVGIDMFLSERPSIALLHKDGVAFLIPELEMDKVYSHPELDIQAFAWNDREGYRQQMQQVVDALGLSGSKRLGVDGMTLRVFEHYAFQNAGVKQSIQDVGDLLLNVRAHKSPEEVEAMRKAIQISEAALEATLAWVKPGMTEMQIANKLSAEMEFRGSQGNAFGPLVLIAERSALPHGFSGDRKLEENDYLLVDYGALYQHYPADITRTFCLGTPTPQMLDIHDIVLKANTAAREIAKPGVTCGEVDAAARQVIEDAGYGKYFMHRTGHGLGLSGHESPNISEGNEQVLEVGMVFTIEPGVYLQGVGGVRIEDDVVVTEDGIDCLTTFPRGIKFNRG